MTETANTKTEAPKKEETFNEKMAGRFQKSMTKLMDAITKKTRAADTLRIEPDFTEIERAAMELVVVFGLGIILGGKDEKGETNGNANNG